MNARSTVSILAVAAFAAGTLVGCSINGGGPWISRGDLTGKTTTETRVLDGFTGVSLSGDATITVTQGEAFSVSVTTDSGLQEHIDTSVKGQTLEIDQDYSIAGRSPGVSVAVTLPRLTDVGLSGSATATIEGIRGDSLHVSSSGSSDISIDAEVKTLAVDVAGSSEIALSGEATSATLTISGSGTVDGSGFESSSADVSVSGSGDVTLRVETTLTASVAGSGDITYYGDPEVSSDVAGSGRVRHAGP
ncbi:MAG: DUF2807 domain-containing protein [Demequinaceae bacterium]|nr:DUF2807 domain-containing protein [Demequinaceae bacterium]